MKKVFKSPILWFAIVFGLLGLFNVSATPQQIVETNSQGITNVTLLESPQHALWGALGAVFVLALVGAMFGLIVSAIIRFFRKEQV
jgi:ABC-type phosphate/phosphonate transport system permease subunit